MKGSIDEKINDFLKSHGRHDASAITEFWLGYDEAKSTIDELMTCPQCWVEEWLRVFNLVNSDTPRHLLNAYTQGQEAAHIDVLIFHPFHKCDGRRTSQVTVKDKVELETKP